MICPATGKPIAHAAVRFEQDSKMEFWDIYDQFYAKVRRFILALVKDEWVADDLIQETFLKIQTNLKSLKDPSKLSSWIFRIAYNLCQDHFRQLKVSRKEERIDQEETEDFKEALMQSGPDIQKELEQRQMGQCVQNYIHLLPEPLRVVLILFDTMDFSQQEIADTLGVTIENVKVRLHRGRKKLRTILEEKCAFERDERNVLVCTPASDGQTRISQKQPDSRLPGRGSSSSKEKAKGRKQSKR
jgi:RNA polymerase sigma-70 factor, ECF subfamily